MENRLEYLEAFREILANYHVSEQSQKILDDTTLALLVAPSSSGRNTIIRELLKTNDYHYIVSDTTRRPRVNDGVLEQNGVEYWFRSERDVLDELKEGKFLEAAIIHNQQVSGISIRELEQARQQGKVAITDIEIVGTDNIVRAKPDTFPLFILPPSFEVWMERLDGRGQMSLEEKRRRLGSAVLEFTAALDNDYFIFVINDDFHLSVKKIQALVQDGQPSVDQEPGRELAKELRKATEAWLYQN
jgi:guanylate kinase